MKLRWDTFSQTMVRYDFPTANCMVSVNIMQRYLKNMMTDRLVRHCHGRFEVQFIWDDESGQNGHFRIIPPGVWHTGILQREAENRKMVTITFLIRDRQRREDEPKQAYSTIMECFRRLTEITEVLDTFGGTGWMLAIRKELQNWEEACFERIRALLYLLMVELALHLPDYVQVQKSEKVCSSDDSLPDRIEEFFFDYYNSAGCSREMLASLLCVSERQLGRILEQIYRKSFRQLLLEYRMEFAEAWRCSDGLTAAEAARKVGYTSVSGFRIAYEKYHGKKYQEQ